MKKVYNKPEIELIDLTSREELMNDSLLSDLDPLLDGDLGNTSKPSWWD